MKEIRILTLRCGGTIECGPTPNLDGRGASLAPDDATWEKIEQHLRRRFKNSLTEMGLEIDVRRLFEPGIPLPDSSKIGILRRHDILETVLAQCIAAAIEGKPYDGIAIPHGTDSLTKTLVALNMYLPSIAETISKILGREHKMAAVVTGSIHAPYNRDPQAPDNIIDYVRDDAGQYVFNPRYDGMRNLSDSIHILHTLLSSDEFQNGPAHAVTMANFYGTVFPAPQMVKRLYPNKELQPFYSPGANNLGRVSTNGEVSFDEHELKIYLEASSYLPAYELPEKPAAPKPEAALYPRRAVHTPRNPDQPRRYVSHATINDWFMYEYSTAVNKDGLRVLVLEGPGEGNFNIDDPRLETLFQEAADKGIIVVMTGQILSIPSANPAYAAGLMPGHTVLNLTGVSGSVAAAKAQWAMDLVSIGLLEDSNAAIAKFICTNHGEFLMQREAKSQRGAHSETTEWGPTIGPAFPYGELHPAAGPFLARIRQSEGPANDNKDADNVRSPARNPARPRNAL